MKNILTILEEEKTRILEMHQNATKRQYLNEQTIGPFNPVTVAQSGINIPLFQPTPKKSSYTTTRWNELRQADKSIAFYGITKGATFQVSKSRGNKVLTSTNAKILHKPSMNGNWAQIDTTRISFFCGKGKFYIQNETTEFYNETLGKALVKYVCGYTPQEKKQPEKPKTNQLTDDQKLEKATNCGHSTWDAYQKSGWKCPGVKNNQNVYSGGGGENTPSSSGTNVSDINTQIQQLLGNQSPTGQITDADIDLILTKLG